MLHCVLLLMSVLTRWRQSLNKALTKAVVETTEVVINASSSNSKTLLLGATKTYTLDF